jgi:hypothetical protein
MTPSPVSFTPVDSARALLRIQAAPEDAFTVTTQRELHFIGFRDASIIELLEPPSPDEALEIERVAGRLIGPTSGALDGAVASWVPAHARDDIAAILQHLPPGDYWMVRSRKKIGAPGRALLGNESQAVDDSLRELHKSDYHYVLAVGATAGVDPDLSRPLLGLTILNYTGQETTQAVWLLQPLTPRGGDFQVENDESLFIIPVTGPLVLDHLEGFSAVQSLRCRKQWAERGARALATDLAAGLARRDRS